MIAIILMPIWLLVLFYFLSPWAANMLVIQGKKATTEACSNNSIQEMDRLYSAANRDARLALYICEYRLMFSQDDFVRKLRLEAMLLKYSSKNIIYVEPTN